jgi:hypothetical protein
MVIGIARDDCPGCGYSELKHSAVAAARQREHELHPVDPLQERIEESLAGGRSRGPGPAAFMTLDPPAELATERRALFSVLGLLGLWPGFNLGLGGTIHGAALAVTLAYLATFGIYQLAVYGSFLALRRVAQAWAMAAGCAALLAPALQPDVLTALACGLPAWTALAWRVALALHCVWTVSFIQCELAAMRV